MQHRSAGSVYRLGDTGSCGFFKMHGSLPAALLLNPEALALPA
jgi:hypothetical protein